MKKFPIIIFLLRLTLFIAILIVFDNLCGRVLRKMYFNQKVGQLAQTTYAIDSASQDILIFGSSKATRQYSPLLISKGTNLSCYNLGRDAQQLPYYVAISEITIKRHLPKLIIVDMMSKELYTDKSKYTKLSILLPYCEKHPEFNEYIKDISSYEKYALLSKIYPFNSLLFIMINNSLFQNKIIKDDLGYLPLFGILTKEQRDIIIKRKNAFDLRNDNEKGLKIDNKSVQYFKKFLNNTSMNGIKTVVVISPSIVKEPEVCINEIKNICTQYSNVTFLDFSNNEKYYLRNEKFSDMFHLNKSGSEEFSNDLNKILKDKLLIK